MGALIVLDKHRTVKHAILVHVQSTVDGVSGLHGDRAQSRAILVCSDVTDRVTTLTRVLAEIIALGIIGMIGYASSLGAQMEIGPHGSLGVLVQPRVLEVIAVDIECATTHTLQFWVTFVRVPPKTLTVAMEYLVETIIHTDIQTTRRSDIQTDRRLQDRQTDRHNRPRHTDDRRTDRQTDRTEDRQ
ncbi:hypothetical protein DPMN_029872 [Dreissena polymorpha]|uniref:Uncharacterized protein n=1 Tax=Dreissena polymorpha TaxID=45954 RepID=A0A9D4RGM6_DREPO|nr:hypothetical protein DPMN_029872 [Dreissena polymorpha]